MGLLGVFFKEKMNYHSYIMIYLTFYKKIPINVSVEIIKMTKIQDKIGHKSIIIDIDL